MNMSYDMSTRESNAAGASLESQLESLSLSSLQPSWTASSSPSSSNLHHGHQIPSSSNSSSPSSNLHQMSLQNQHASGGQSGVVVPNATQSTDMDSSGLGVKMAEYVLGTPPKECPLSLQSPDEFSFANAIQQAANHASHHHITSMAPSHSSSTHSPPGSAGGNSSGGPASSSQYYNAYGPPGPQPQHMPSHGQVVGSNPDMCGALPQPGGGVNGIVQAAPPQVPNAYLANLLTNYFTTLTPGTHPASNGMHTPPSAYSAAAAVYHASHSYVDGPMRYGWTPPPPPPPPPPPQTMNHPPSNPYSAGSMSLPLSSQAPFDPMRGRVGGGAGPSFPTGWPSPQRINPKVCVSKKKNETKLIKEFKSNRYPDLELRDLHGHVIEFAQDQQGSRFIQHKLESATQPEKQMIFNEIFTWVYSLMTHEFGNYVVQKLFDFGSDDQKLALAGKMANHIVNLTMHIYGCRVMQKALVSLPPEVRKKLIDELRGHVVHCANDENGNHVMQKCFETIEPGYLQFIVDECLGKVRQLCSHSYACRVIQRLLEYCKFEQSIPVLQEIHVHVLELAQDQYGNYVIQYILQHGLPKDKSAIIQSIRGNVVPLSCHKYASNVLEKCVTHGSSLERTVLMEEVCATKDGIFKMMKDPFANYVVQRMVEVADQHYSKLLVQKIALNKEQLQKSTSGKHALAKLEKYLYKYLSGSTTTSSTSSCSSSNITGNNNNNNNNNQNNNSQQSNQQLHNNNNLNQNQQGGVVNNLQNLNSSHGLSSSMSSGCMHNNNALNGVVSQNSQTRDSDRCQSVSVVSTGQSGLAQSCSQ